MKHITISETNLPTRLPILPGITLWLLLDRLNAPDLVVGAIGCFYLFLLAGSIVRFIKEERRDVAGFGKGGVA